MLRGKGGDRLQQTVLPLLVDGLVIGGTYALIAIGLTVVFGLMNVVNFAHGELYMLGAYFAFALSTQFGLNYFASVFLAVMAVILVGYLADRVILKPLRGAPIISTALVTIGLSIFLQNTVRIIWGPNPQRIDSPFLQSAIQLGPVRVTPDRLFAFAVTLVLLGVLHWFIHHTKPGRALRATFQDRDAAALQGVETDRVFSWTFAAGSALAAVAGTLLGSIFLTYPTMGDMANLKAFTVVVLGGMGNLAGAILGGFTLGVVESLAAGLISSGYKDAIGFAFVILILTWRPHGLFGRRAL